MHEVGQKLYTLYIRSAACAPAITALSMAVLIGRRVCLSINVHRPELRHDNTVVARLFDAFPLCPVAAATADSGHLWHSMCMSLCILFFIFEVFLCCVVRNFLSPVVLKVQKSSWLDLTWCAKVMMSTLAIVRQCTSVTDRRTLTS